MPPPDSHHPKVFISYSHDSPEHSERVRELSDRLRADGIDSNLDQYEVLPPEGWARWMEKQIRDAEFVLMVCTDTYYRRVMGKEKPGTGLGVSWEGNLIYEHIYNAQDDDAKFVPVLLDPGTASHIPAPLRRLRSYDLFADEGYESLYRHLTNQRYTIKPKVAQAVKPKQRTLLTNLTFKRNPFFTGREQILTDLRTGFSKGGATGQTQAISGLGGVGKSQIAIEYAYRQSNDYNGVFWVRSDSQLALSSGFAEIARLLNLPEKDAQNPDDVVRGVNRWLENNSGWLLIFDNADQPELLKSFWPSNATGHVLLTSRAQVFDALGVVKPIEIDVMSLEEAVKFLFLRTGRDGNNEAERSAAVQLAEELGRLPLALEQVGAFVAAQKARFQDYLSSYRRRRLELLQEPRPIPGDYPESVATTWALNFREIEEVSEAASDLLRASAFLSPDRIPLELISQGRVEFGEAVSQVLAEVDEDPLALNRVLEPLIRYSFVRVDADSQTYNIHPLVQQLMLDRMDSNSQRIWVERIVRALNEVFPSVEFENWASCERLLPHSRIAAELIDKWEVKVEEAARLLNQVASFCYLQGRYAEAEKLYKQSLAIYEITLSPDHPVVASSLNNLAELYREQGRYADAELLYNRSLLVREKAFGIDNPQVATSLNNLAALHTDQGKYAEAETLYRRSLAIRQSVLASEHPDVALSLNNLAGLYRAQGRYAEAEPLYKQSLSIFEKVLGQDHPHVATSLNNLAGLYRLQGRYREAEPLFRRALAIFQQGLGPDHPTVTISLNNLAGVLQATGLLSEAEPLYRHSLRIDEATFGKSHPTVAEDLNNLATLLFKMGRTEEAESLYDRVIKIDEESSQTDEQSVGIHLNNFASLMLASRRFDEAKSLLRRSVSILEKAVGQDHPLTKQVRQNLEAVQ